jgi:hypothetical protein
MALQEDLIRVSLALGLLLAGFFAMKVFSRLLLKANRAAHPRRTLTGKPLNTGFEKIFFALIIITALGFLGFTSVEDFAYRFVSILPELLLFILLFILGVLIIQFICWLLKKIVMYTRIEELVTEDISRNLIPLIFVSLKVILYIILLEVTVSVIDVPEIQKLTDFIVYPVLIIIFLVLFVALINPVRDFSASFYLKNLWTFKPGNRVKYSGNMYTIKSITWLSTELESGKGDSLVVPNRVLAGSGMEFQKPPREMQTLEQIKDRFVAQEPSMCGPASAQIALSIFNIRADQKELAKLSDAIRRTDPDMAAGTHPKKLIGAVQRFTDDRVIGVWIGFDKIYHLKQEVSRWLSDGALLIADYKKRYLFPTALRAHYSLVVGVRGDEILMIDPSGKKGGVYFVDYRDVMIGMDTYSELIRGKRGYIVLAPHGTAAYKRIREGLVYSHPSMYDRLSRALQMKLDRMTSTPALVDMLPDFMKRHLKTFEKEQVSRVWRP